MASPLAPSDAHGALLSSSNGDQFDAAFLRDAVAFLDAAESFELMPRETKRVKITKPSTVERRRDEIADLRQHVQELEETWTCLRKRRRGEAASKPVDTVVLWEAIATHQREQRELALLENERLRRALDELIKQRDALAWSLRSRKRADLKTTDDEPRHAPSHERPSGLISSSEALFGELMGSLQQQYLDTPSALVTVRSMPNFHPLRSSYHARTTSRRTIQLMEHVIYPFPYGDTVPEVWQALSGVADDKPGINFNSVDMRDDSFRLELKIDVQLQRKRAEFSLTTVAKRIVEPHRTVIVWTGIAVPSGVGGVNMDGISIRQRGWSVVEPMGGSELAGGSTPAATRLTMFFEDAALVEDTVSKKGHKVTMLLQYLINIYAVEGGARRQQTENKLFDKSMRTRQ